MAKIILEKEKCIGCGTCSAICGELFEMEETKSRLRGAKKENEEVSRDEFTYSGPNPETPEAAIVMLADTVDAATRTLKKPTLTKLDKMVWSLMVGRLEEGLLNESSLNFQDLEQIRDAFVKVLAGYFHTRIEYPGEE